MGTTTNNGWTYPESTDLVKDGATAIQTLADDIDTTLGVYADPGLVLLNTTSFSGVTSVSSAAATFSSTYTNYYLTIDAEPVGSNEIFLRLILHKKVLNFITKKCKKSDGKVFLNFDLLGKAATLRKFLHMHSRAHLCFDSNPCLPFQSVLFLLFLDHQVPNP